MASQGLFSFLFLQTKAPAAPGADVHADHAEEVFYPTQAEAEAAALKLGCTGIGRLLRPRLLPIAMRTLTGALLICQSRWPFELTRSQCQPTNPHPSSCSMCATVLYGKRVSCRNTPNGTWEVGSGQGP